MVEHSDAQAESLDEQALTQHDVRTWQNDWVFDEHGEAIGKVSDVLVDDDHKPEWMVISYGAFLREDRLVPVFDIRREPEGFVVSYSKDLVRHAPVVRVESMSDADEQKLMSYWCTTRDATSPRACTYLGR